MKFSLQNVAETNKGRQLEHVVYFWLG